MRNGRACFQQCWKSLRKSCANGSNIVALCFGGDGTKDILGVVEPRAFSNMQTDSPGDIYPFLNIGVSYVDQDQNKVNLAESYMR